LVRFRVSPRRVITLSVHARLALAKARGLCRVTAAEDQAAKRTDVPEGVSRTDEVVRVIDDMCIPGLALPVWRQYFRNRFM
jgi:hypothetical protein